LSLLLRLYIIVFRITDKKTMIAVDVGRKFGCESYLNGFQTTTSWKILLIQIKRLYYYMRTKDYETHTMLTEFMDHFYEKVCKDKDDSSPNR